MRGCRARIGIVVAFAAVAVLLVVIPLSMVAAHKLLRLMATAEKIYQVQLSWRISGIPVHGPTDRVEVDTDWGGSATAVSWDGDLMTARHVVDLGFFSPEICKGLYYHQGRTLMLQDARIVQMSLTVVDPISYRSWVGIATPMAGGQVCDAAARLRLVWDPASRATVVAIDSIADLALVRIATEDDIPHFMIDWTGPEPGAEATALGVPGGRLSVGHGSIIKPCVMEQVTHPYHALMAKMEMHLRLIHGMSGGPVVDDADMLIGIGIQTAPPYAYAVPMRYAGPWYDWVKGRRLEPPVAECPVETIVAVP